MEAVSNYARLYKLNINNEHFKGILIKDIIEDTEADDLYCKNLWRRYTQATGYLPIESKTASDISKANNQLKHDFRGEIVDSQTSYFLGKQISYTIGKDVGERERERIRTFIDDNNLEDIDNETGTRCAVCGKSGRLLYQQDGQFWISNLFAWEYKIIDDITTGKPLFAIRYYDVITAEGKRKTQAEFYTDFDVQYFTEDETGYFVPDSFNSVLPEYADDSQTVKQTIYPHSFGLVPIVEFTNNNRKAGDFAKVEALIDAYDMISSLNVDDIEELRDAYLFLKNMTLTSEQKVLLKKYHLIETMSENADGKYITKNLNPEHIKSTLDRIKNDIYRLSQTVDFSDESFSGGGMSGESRKYKLMSMENKRLSKVAAYKRGLDQQYIVLATGWDILNSITVDPNEIYYEFAPNIPLDVLYYAEIASKLKGFISHRTILDFLPPDIVSDTDYELELLKEEQSQYLSLMDMMPDKEEEPEE